MQIYEKLGAWYEKEKRDLPWRNSSDPYKIWLSEIILQQTRVTQGTSYYQKFIEEFPDVFLLANAETEKVLKIWQGLGYYSRARNLHETARFIAFKNKGEFPSSYDELIKLKGIGEYTASAISSIAFNEAKAAVDGNVKRVISRLFFIEDEINSPEGKKAIDSLALDILDPKNPGRHNQAMMELGAKVCLPKKPDCLNCPLNSVCLALKEKKVAELPLKYKKSKAINRYFNYLIIKKGETIRVQKRIGGDIWEGLFEFPLIVTPELPDLNQLPYIIAGFLETDISSMLISNIEGPVTHKLTHQNIITRFINISFLPGSEPQILPGDVKNIKDFNTLPVPRLIARFISSHGF